MNQPIKVLDELNRYFHKLRMGMKQFGLPPHMEPRGRSRRYQNKAGDRILEDIRQRAYFLSQQDPSRSPEANWTQAQREVMMSTHGKTAICCPGWAWFLLLAVVVGILVILANLVRGIVEGSDFYVQHPGVASFLYYWGIAVSSAVLIKLFSTNSDLLQGIRWLADGLVQIGEGKTRWDWVKILGGPTLFGAIAGVISFMYNQSNQSLTKILATEKEREQIMNSYISDMTSMLSRAKWINFTHDSRLAISTRTLNTMEGLQKDGLRQGIALRFASRVFPDFICLDSDYNENEPKKYYIKNALDANCRWPSNISLSKVQLQHFNIDDSNDLYRGMLKYADLRWSNLSESNLQRADLSDADLRHANLSNTRFSPITNLQNSNLENANIDNAIFDGTDISNTLYVETNIRRRFMRWCLLRVGINPDILDTNTLMGLSTLLVGEAQLKSSFDRATFSTIKFKKNPLYVEYDRFPQEWIMGKPKRICTLIQQGRVNFEEPDYQSIMQNKKDPKKGKNPNNPPSPYSTVLIATDSTQWEINKYKFSYHFKKKFGCEPFHIR